MNLDRACDIYLAHLQVERNLSPHTLESYGRDLRELRIFLAARKVTAVDDMSICMLRAWLQDLAQRGLQPASQNRALSAMRQFCKYLHRERILPRNLGERLRSVTVHRPLPFVPSRKDAARLIEAGGAPDASPRSLRSRAALELLYGAGLRASEVCFLQLDDLQAERGLIRSRGKGGRERLIPLGMPARAALLAYLRAGRGHFLRGESPYVFLGNQGKPLSRMALFNLVRRQALRAGVARPLSPHAMRHAFATHLLQGGADLRAVQEMLGHASIATTEIYTHVTQDELQKTVDLFHPLGAPRK